MKGGPAAPVGAAPPRGTPPRPLPKGLRGHSRRLHVAGAAAVATGPAGGRAPGLAPSTGRAPAAIQIRPIRARRPADLIAHGVAMETTEGRGRGADAPCWWRRVRPGFESRLRPIPIFFSPSYPSNSNLSGKRVECKPFAGPGLPYVLAWR